MYNEGTYIHETQVMSISLRYTYLRPTHLLNYNRGRYFVKCQSMQLHPLLLKLRLKLNCFYVENIVISIMVTSDKGY